MSRIGFKPVALPAGVEAHFDGDCVIVKGPKGEVNVHIPADVSVSLADGQFTFKAKAEPTPSQGTIAALITNAIKGVTEGFKKELELNGTGYRASIVNGSVKMFLGYSHDIVVAPIGKYTKITCPDETHITVEGVDKQQVGQTAAHIYDSHRPDVYGQKGVHYKGQHLIKKVGKRAAASGKK